MLISTVLILVSILGKSKMIITSIQSSLLLEACVVLSTNFAIFVSLHGFRLVVMIFCPEEDTSRALKKSS